MMKENVMYEELDIMTTKRHTAQKEWLALEKAVNPALVSLSEQQVPPRRWKHSGNNQHVRQVVNYDRCLNSYKTFYLHFFLNGDTLSKT